MTSDQCRLSQLLGESRLTKTGREEVHLCPDGRRYTDDDQQDAGTEEEEGSNIVKERHLEEVESV